jgi:hypothetical protein
MTKLTPAHTELLTRIAAAPEGVLEAPSDAATTIKALIKRGFAISMPVAEGPSNLLITEAGRKEIAVPPAPKAVRRAKPAESPPTTEPQPKPAPAPKGKIATLVELLRREEGASIETMMEATGWQSHSVRGAMSGSVKKALGVTITSEKTDAGRIYRIVDGEGA